MLDNENKEERKIENLMNLVENHTRTKRHLEQYSHIGNPKNKESARELQHVRENEMQTLKNDILGKNKNTQSTNEQINDIEENYESTQGYINNNRDHMNTDMLENMKNKQKNRKEQRNNLQKNKKDTFPE